jgi:high-affinity iron transporter
MGAALLGVSKMREKWRLKFAKAFEPRSSVRQNRVKLWAEEYAMYLLPFITVLREGVEAVLFDGGVSISTQASSILQAVLAGVAAGC